MEMQSRNACWNGEFSDMDIDICQTDFFNCRFINCRLLFSGEGSVVANGCEFIHCSFLFTGKAAFTLGFLSQVYRASSPDGSIAQFVERIFDDIRSGRVNDGGGGQELNPDIQSRRFEVEWPDVIQVGGGDGDEREM